MSDSAPHTQQCEPSTAHEGGLTVIIQRKAVKGKSVEMEQALAEISELAAQFPGNLGQNIIRPVDPNNPEYVIIIRFDSYENLMNWHTSDVRQQWVARVQPISEGEPKIRTVQGMSAWFDLPNGPPRWKTASVIFVALLPLVIGLGELLALTIGGVHQYIRQILAVGITVIIMTWFAMPRLNRWLKSWLFKGREVRLPKDAQPLE